MADDDIIRGGLDIVTDKKNNKPKAEQETAQPTAARFKKTEGNSRTAPAFGSAVKKNNKPKAEQETAQPTAAQFNNSNKNNSKLEVSQHIFVK